jgi:hypothetical protein
MDAHHFDALVRDFVTSGSRRGLLRVLAALPLVGGLAALRGEEGTDAKGRCKHAHRTRHVAVEKKHKKKRHKKKCRPQSLAQTCAGTCGPVKNNCKQTVDCGPCECDPPCGACETCSADRVCEKCDPCCNDVCCAQTIAVCHVATNACCLPDTKAQTCNNQCGEVLNNCGVGVDCGPCTCSPACPACQVCDDDTGDCVPDPEQQGDACGEPGQVCQGDGSCACDASSCAECATCQGDGTCSAPCNGTGCCASGTCAAGTADPACGRNGEPCQSCSGAGVTCGGGGTAGVCGCTPLTTCPSGLDCGAIDDGCGRTLNCGDCTAPETCGGGNPGTPNVCGCTPTTCAAQGTTCGTLSDGCGGTLKCGTCCSGGNPCPGGGCCDAEGQCQISNANACGPDGGACAGACADDEACQNGLCVSCAAACSGCSQCIREVNGSTRCITAFPIVDCEQGVCTSSSSCVVDGYFCAISQKLLRDETVISFGPICDQSAGAGICVSAAAC